MTYGEFKGALEALTQGDGKLPPDDRLKQLCRLAIIDVAALCDPFALVTCDPQALGENPPLRLLDNKTFVRNPKAPVEDSDTLDIDDVLAMAVVHFAAAKLVRNLPELNRKSYHKEEALGIVNAFLWGNYETLEADTCGR